MEHNKPHILFLLGALRAGGAERVITSMANYLVKKGYKISMIHLNTLEHFYSVDSNIEQYTLDIASRSSNFMHGLVNTRKRVLKIRNLISKINPDLVVSFFTDINVLTIWANKKLNIPLIISERNNPYRDEIPRHWKLGRKRLYDKADKLILQTDKVRAFYRHIDQEKIRIIPNPLKEIDREEKAEEKFILAAGRLVPQKGMDLLIKAFGKSQAREKWNLVILGEGQELSNLQKLVRENKLNEKVDFKGNRKDIDKFFATASVFVLSSRYEGFPNVLAEAMGAGLPCISFDCDFGPRELIEHQRNGILVETGNVDKLAEKIDELASNKGKRNTMGEEAKKIREKLNMNAIMQQWEEVFAEMVNQKVNG